MGAPAPATMGFSANGGAGSQIAKAAASVNPASSIAPSTVMVSMVPPLAQLSLWSSSSTGRVAFWASACAACSETSRGSLV